MNVYDFDKTIYNGDSTVDFYIYSLKKKPSLILCLPEQIMGFLLYKLKKISKTQFKERFFCFLCKYDAKSCVEDFWKEKSKNIYPWYLKIKKDDDVIISASPRFLLEPLCRSLDIENLIASEVDIKTGKFSGQNCKGEEKVRRFKEVFPSSRIDSFYSDSLSDLPLAKIAVKSYIIKDGKIRNWENIGD